jgi:hypothetical protein
MAAGKKDQPCGHDVRVVDKLQKRLDLAALLDLNRKHVSDNTVAQGKCCERAGRRARARWLHAHLGSAHSLGDFEGCFADTGDNSIAVPKAKGHTARAAAV